MTLISLVVAVGQNGVIGRGGGLPWRMSSDLKSFRRLTMGKPIVMGRKTFQSIGRPLDGRDNIVVTRDPHFAAEGVTAMARLDEALILARALARTKGEDEIMVIGGADVFQAALPLAERIYWTAVQGAPEGDVTFGPLDLALWQEKSREKLARGPRDDYDADLVIYQRRPRESAPAP